MDNTELLNRSCSTFGTYTRDFQLVLGSATHPATATWQQIELLRHFLNASKQGYLSEVSIIGYINCNKCFVDTKEELELAFPELTINCVGYYMVAFLENKQFNSALKSGYSSYMIDENAVADGLIVRNIGGTLVDTEGNAITTNAYSFDKSKIEGVVLSKVVVKKDTSDTNNGKMWDLSYFKATKTFPLTGSNDSTVSSTVGTIIGSKWFTSGFGGTNIIRCVCPCAIDGNGSFNFDVCKYVDFGTDFTTFSYTYSHNGSNVRCLILRSKAVVSIQSTTLTYEKVFVPESILDNYITAYPSISFYPIGGTTWKDYFTKPTAFDGDDEYWDDYGADPKVQQLIAGKVPLADQYDLLSTTQQGALQQTIAKIGKLGSGSPYAGLCRRERLWYLELYPDLYSDFIIPTE